VRQQKSIPWEKFYISAIVADLVTKFTVITGEDSGHTCSQFRYNIWFDLKITTISTSK